MNLNKHLRLAEEKFQAGVAAHEANHYQQAVLAQRNVIVFNYFPRKRGYFSMRAR
jgi:hypothetical protein